MQRIDHPFPPVVDAHCRFLILGSFPSVRSRADGFFYGHPQNRFWRVLAAIFGETAPADIPTKKEFLLRHHIALWDVIASCEIKGSSDASIKNAIPVDISRVTDIAGIECIICNGNLAHRLYQRHLEAATGIKAVVLPSTSPANAAFTMDKLIAAWQTVLLQ